MTAWRTAHMALTAISMHRVSLFSGGVHVSAMLGPEHSHARMGHADRHERAEVA